jgi:hypothetical protein
LRISHWWRTPAGGRGIREGGVFGLRFISSR